MVDFAAHCTIHAIKIGFQNTTFYLESIMSLKVVHVPIACQSEHSPCYFHLDRISNSIICCSSLEFP